MTTEDLSALESFLIAGAPSSPYFDLPTGHRGGGIRLTWHARTGHVVAGLSVSPASGLCCIHAAEFKTRDHRRVEATLGLLADVAAFARAVEREMERIKGAELVLKTTEARR